MAYAIMRMKKQYSLADLAQAGAHNERERETPNANPERTPLNERLLGSGDLVADVQARLDAVGITKVRAAGPRDKGAVRAVEIVQTASPEWFHQATPQQVREWVDRSTAWLTGRFGDNLVSLSLHLDETSPNMHAFVVPITSDGKLSHKKLFGDWDGPKKLMEMQTSYAQAVAHLGLERGTEGSKATHQEIQDFYHRMQRGTRQAWELANQITIAPAPGMTHEEQVAAAVAPVLAAETAKVQYWQQRAEQSEQQLAGAREQARRHAYTREEYGQLINRVRDTDLTDVIQGLGATRDRHDPHKWHLDDKLINIRGDKYADFHAPAGSPLARRGGAIDLVQHVTGKSFAEAVDYLNTRHYGGRVMEAPARDRPAQEQAAPALPALPQAYPERWAEVRRYLVEARTIPAHLVDQAHDRGDIYATEYRGYPNAVFVRRDEQGQPVAAAIRGTRGDFQQITTRAGAFAVEFGTPNRARPASLVLVESPIDALSYAALYLSRPRSQQHEYGRVLSTDGNGPLPRAEIDRTLQGGGTVRAAFDNDGPGGGGARLWDAVKQAYPRETSGDYTPIMRQTPKAKDWNEDLQRMTMQRSMSGPSMGPSMGR